jgi:hypothetical protein
LAFFSGGRCYFINYLVDDWKFVLKSAMITKHFFKVLILFAGMIILGLTGIFLVSYFDKAQPGNNKAIQVRTCENGEVC